MLEPGTLVLVTWRDSYFDFESGTDGPRDYLVRTVGFVVKVTTDYLGIAQEELPDDDGWRAVTWIPLAMIEGRPVPLEPGG